MYKMKKKSVIILSMLVTMGLTACGGKGNDLSKLESQNAVQSAIDEQIAKEVAGGEDNSEPKAPEAKVENEPTTEMYNALTTEKKKEEKTEEKKAEKAATTTDAEASGDVDIDLTTMSSDMIYSTVYQLMMDPQSYVGMKIKIMGNYYSQWLEDTQQNYHFVIIQDATACCKQGMEFVWEDGSHVYPDEYPAENAEVEVIGTFETYKDNPDDEFDYCRLGNAKLVILDSSSNNQ